RNWLSHSLSDDRGPGCYGRILLGQSLNLLQGLQRFLIEATHELPQGAPAQTCCLVVILIVSYERLPQNVGHIGVKD
ncbi:MAG TPA: hypothetical protein VKU00_25470, partial [Chthonomonadaceae bacterium]|nr:hypothetical protein [Chthonomonadaceae bacterium]